MNEELKNFSQYKFSTADYVIFLGMVIASTSTGVYFGWIKPILDERKKKDKPADDTEERKADFGSSKISEYLLGSRQLTVFPVAMSLVASYISGVTILGTTSEIYNYGTQYWLITVAIVFMAITVSRIYLPVFTTLQVQSSYEYLGLRFNSAVRSFASFLFVMDEIIFLPFIVYVPAIALNQVTDINVYVVSAIIIVVCVFYTVVGGIKAVVHTDAWQVLVMFLSVVVVVILGTYFANGPVEVFKRAEEGGRLIFFNTSTSPYDRQTVLSVLIGGFCYWTSFNAVNQTMVQRYMSLPTVKKARQSILIFTIGIVLFVSMCCFGGLLIYDLYHDCDPLNAGLISHTDQLMPIYVIQTVGHLKGIPGLFIAGVFGAALSSLSVVLNSTALVILEDFVRGAFRMKPSEFASRVLIKTTVLVLGAVALALIFVLEKLSGVLGVATAMTAIAAGTTFGIFTLGMLVPWANSTGAIAGAVVGSLISGWIAVGTQITALSGKLGSHKLPVSIEQCPGNITVTQPTLIDDSNVFPLYRLSFHWVNPIGISLTVITGAVVSYLSGGSGKNVDPDLISPVLHRCLPKEAFEIRAKRIGGGQSTHLLEQL